MRRVTLSLMIVVGCALGCAELGPSVDGQAAEPAARKTPAAVRGEAKAVMVERGPVIDGTLDSPLWAKCPPIELGHATSSRPAQLRTTARVLFDPTHLYLAVSCAEPDTDGMKKNVTKRDGAVYADDSIEFFITGDPRVGYFQFAFNAIGTVMDGQFKPGRSLNRSWNCSVEVKTKIEKDKNRWILTAKFPLKDLAAYVGNDQVWAMNINRNHTGGKGRRGEHLAWSVMEKTDWHAVNDYGIIDGVNIPKRADGVTRVVAPMPRPPKYLRGTEVGGVRVYVKVDAIEAPDKGKGTQHSMPLPLKGSRGLKMAFVARGTNGVKSIPLNVFDARSRDNTTPIAYYWVGETWRPILYRFSQFRYNSVVESRVGPATDFRSIFFHGNRTGGKGVLSLRGFVVYRGDDRSAPAAPTGLAARVTGKGVQLSWKAAADNVGVAGYAVSRADASGKFAKVGQTALPGFLDRPVNAGRLRYRVLAFDFQANLSAWSRPTTVAVRKGFSAPPASREEKDRAGYAAHVRKVHDAGAGKVVKGRVLCYGDSLTGATNYRHYVDSCLGNYEVIASGYPGQRTSYGKRRAEEHMKRHNPEFCLILFGTNNSKGSRNIPPAMADLMAIAKACEKNGTVPVIATIPPRRWSPESKPEKNFNAELVKTCRKNGVPIAYIFEAYQESGVNRRKLLAGDGVHTVSGGWVCMGKAWRAAMEQVRFVVLDRP